MCPLAWARWLRIIDRKIPAFPIAKNQTPASEGIPRRSAAMARAGPYVVVEVEARACPLRQLQNPGGSGCFRIYRPSSVRRFQLGSCDCCHKLLFEHPSFFGRRVIDVQSPKRQGFRAYSAATLSLGCAIELAITATGA